LSAYGATACPQGFAHWLRRGKGQGRTALPGEPVDPLHPDCAAGSPPAGFTRIFVPAGADVDAALRVYSGDPAGGVPPADHLIVCLAEGTFDTDGDYNHVINV